LNRWTYHQFVNFEVQPGSKKKRSGKKTRTGPNEQEKKKKKTRGGLSHITLLSIDKKEEVGEHL